MPEQSTSDGTHWRYGLSFRLFGLTVLVILFTELLIFIPSAKGERDSWLDERIETSRVAALALTAAPSRQVSKDLSDELFLLKDIISVAEFGTSEDGFRQLLLAPRYVVDGATVEMINRADESYLKGLLSTIETVLLPQTGHLRVLHNGSSQDQMIEIMLPEAPLREALVAFSGRIIGLSLLISASAGALVYVGLFFLVVRPIRRVTASLEQFSTNPGAWTRRSYKSAGRDEISRAANALHDMETVVSEAFRERERLAQLGEAVAKINHDLRNSLAAAQLVSDGLSRSEDPRVQRAVPRLERVLERAIKLTQDTLQFGRAKQPEPDIQQIRLHDAVEEAAREGLAAGNQTVKWTNDVPAGVCKPADGDHLHRIIANLVRNAAQALSPQGDTGEIRISYSDDALFVMDNGPGLPAKARGDLFTAFAGSSKRDGSGLGLAIARELARGMGGDLALERTGETGTCFQIKLPAL